MVNNPSGSGMGTSGLVGQIMAFQSMTESGVSVGYTLFQIVLMHFVLPAVLAFGISTAMRKLNLIKDGDMKLQL